MTTVHAVLHGNLCGDNFLIGDFDVKLLFERVFGVASYTASVHHSERRAERHAASENDFIAAALAQEVHRLAHKLSARLVVSGFDCGGIEEVELDHIEVPLVKHLVEKRFDICPNLFFFEIESIKTAPRYTAQHGFAVFAADEPIGMILYDVCAELRRKRRVPKPRFVAV